MKTSQPKALIPDCKLFTGYKPCLPYKTCEGCPDPQPFGKKILIVNLDNIGAVLMTTAQLPGVKRVYPENTIYWLTQKMCMPALEHNPYLHEVFPWSDESRMILRAMQFDLVLNADKNRNSCAFVGEIDAQEKRGFGLNENGATVPLNAGAEYNFLLGAHDYLKFRENKRTAQDILAETWEIPYARDEYVLQLTEDERTKCESWRAELGLNDARLVVGLNTGCSNQY
ncbi:MAG: glycosyltransferase family 9 protein, partial [bacterium]